MEAVASDRLVACRDSRGGAGLDLGRAWSGTQKPQRRGGLPAIWEEGKGGRRGEKRFRGSQRELIAMVSQSRLCTGRARLSRPLAGLRFCEPQPTFVRRQGSSGGALGQNTDHSHSQDDGVNGSQCAETVRSCEAVKLSSCQAVKTQAVKTRAVELRCTGQVLATLRARRRRRCRLLLVLVPTEAVVRGPSDPKAPDARFDPECSLGSSSPYTATDHTVNQKGSTKRALLVTARRVQSIMYLRGDDEHLTRDFTNGNGQWLRPSLNLMLRSGKWPRRSICGQPGNDRVPEPVDQQSRPDGVSTRRVILTAPQKGEILRPSTGGLIDAAKDREGARGGDALDRGTTGSWMIRSIYEGLDRAKRVDGVCARKSDKAEEGEVQSASVCA
ncbi:hypothetical protein BJ875DRAFT_446456 [Amylocarpus encephaloides]|uniref:Uncharacterized protein n=1 Tax=Amylocarpus encephaloides TaxID=45428 RepID=A0A9P7Y7P7_9HELO|nr:hypothetical protein BJ875DRAFT_446456 [Amylocarpus encephaloides]